jgi:DNA anti-recombination protein RmuC
MGALNMTSLDKQSSVADDGHIPRIVRLETQMDHVTSILAALQRTQEEQHHSALARFEGLRDRIDQAHLQTLDRINEAQMQTLDRINEAQMQTLDRINEAQMHTLDRVNQAQGHTLDRVNQAQMHTLDRIDRLQERMDRHTRWLVGLMLANVTATAGILARSLLA